MHLERETKRPAARINAGNLSNLRRMIVLALIASFVIGVNGITEVKTPLHQGGLETRRESVALAAEIHGTIAIDGDANFSATALDEGWPGDGTKGNPYRIEGLQIDCTSTPDTHCIEILNTNVSFIINGCFTGNSTKHGIRLDNVTHAAVINSVSANVASGIQVVGSSDIILMNNTCRNNIKGITIRGFCASILVENNTCTSSSDYGIWVVDSEDINLVNNTCNDNNQSGVYLYQSRLSSLFNNTCIGNNGYGIYFYDSGSSSISWNTCNNNSEGIFISGHSGNNITNNICSHNDNYGIRLSGCNTMTLANNTLLNNNLAGFFSFNADFVLVSNCTFLGNGQGISLSSLSENNTVLWNSFIDNTVDALDDGSYNFFDHNYWSNYTGEDVDENGIGDTPYSFSGNSDQHPLYYNPSISWNPVPDNQATEAGKPWSYDLNVNSESPVVWTISDTSHFSIDNNGNITIHTFLPAGLYELQVWVANIYGIEIDAVFQLLLWDATPPIWSEPVEDQLAELETAFFYDLNATDVSGIGTWWLNDTDHFSVDAMGVVRNSSVLSLKQYGIQISVNDTEDNVLTDVFTVTVVDTTPPVLEITDDLFIEVGTDLHHDLNASDPSGLGTWWVNDTSRFSIDANGVLSNLTVLDIGIYPITVYVNDTYGNTASADFLVTIGTTVRVVVLKCMYTDTPEYGVWDYLNQYWNEYGITQFIVDYTTFSSTITLQGLQNSGADVLYVSGITHAFSETEIEAIKTYVRQGHGFVVAYDALTSIDSLWSFFGLAEPMPGIFSSTTLTENFTMIDTLHPIFDGLPNPFTNNAPYTIAPHPLIYDGWTESMFGLSTPLALSGVEGVILTYRGMIYCSHTPAYNMSSLDRDQIRLLCNILKWSEYSYPDHEVSIELELVGLEVEGTAEIGQTIIVGVTITSEGLMEETDLSCELFINGTLSDSLTIPSLLFNTSIYVTFEWTPSEEGAWNITVHTASLYSEETYDNNADQAIVRAHLEIKHVLWDMSHGNAPSNEFSEVLDAILIQGQLVSENHGNGINSSLLSAYDTLVIVYPVIPYSPSEISDIHSFVMGGGGLIVICGDNLYANPTHRDILNALTGIAGVTWNSTGSVSTSKSVEVSHPLTVGAYGISMSSSSGRMNISWPAIGLFKYSSSNDYVLTVSQLGQGKIVCASNGLFGDGEMPSYRDNLLVAKNMFEWTAYPAYDHDVMAHVIVEEQPRLFLGVNSTFSIVNLGTHVEEFLYIEFRINDELVFADVVSSLNISSYHQWVYYWEPTESGIYNYTISVRPVPGESVTTNNVFSAYPLVLDSGITITSDLDFETQGWPGSGTSEDPYRIENQHIRSTMGHACITIENTRVHFIIQDCVFMTDFILSPNQGIWISNATNGIIRYNVFLYGDYGIQAINISEFVIANNTFSSFDDAIYLEDSNGISLQHNSFENNDAAISLSNSNSTYMANNTLINNSNGLFISSGSLDSQIIWNSFRDNQINALDDGASSTYFENYWSNYTGVDADFDGFGDTPHPIPGAAGSFDSHPLALPQEGPFVYWEEVPDDAMLEYSEALELQFHAVAVAGIDHYWVNDTSLFGIGLSGILSNATILPHGFYALEIRAYDSYGHYCSTSITITVFDDDEPTWITVPSSQIVEIGDEWTYDLDASDVSGLYWGLNDTSRFHIDENGVVSMNYVLAVGTYWLQVWVSDAVGNTLEGTFSVVVEDTQPPIWLYEPTDQMIDFGSTFSYTVYAMDNSALDYYWLNDTGLFQVDSSGLITNNTMLECGQYNLEIRAYDIHGHYCTAVIRITVTDVTMPIVDHPSDISYVEGETGNSISWHPQDDNPVNYEIWCDDTLLDSGDWLVSNQEISISVDGLEHGIYIYNIVAFDYAGHYVTDSVAVIVTSPESTSTSTTTPTTTGPSTQPTLGFDPLLTLALGVVVGGSLVAIIFFIVGRRKR